MKRESLITQLAMSIASGNIVTVVGTGISVAVTKNQTFEERNVATWKGLLQHGVDHCKSLAIIDEDEANLLMLQISMGKTDYLILAAEMICKQMKQRSLGVYRGWLKQALGSLNAIQPELVAALHRFPGILATLNYDNLIEDITGRRPVTWLQSDEIEDLVSVDPSSSVLHLHGWYKDPDSVVLGLSSYTDVRTHPHAQAVLQLFAIGKTFLFVGCGSTFEDPNFSQLLEWAKVALTDVTPRHILLCRANDLDKYRRELSGAPWLQPLVYGESHDDLLPFLLDLIPHKAAVPHQTPIRSVIDFDGYRKAMKRRYSRLKLEDLDPTTHDISSLTLSAMFVEQNAKECHAFVPRIFELPKELQQQLRSNGELEGEALDDAILAQHQREYIAQSARPISEVLLSSQYSRVVILGDPGSGKSSLLQHILLQWGDSTLADMVRKPIPILIELRDYALNANPTDDVLDYLQNGRGLRWHFQRAVLESYLRENPALVLFDGLDEIFDLRQRRLITTAIHRFANEFPNARIIVTSRVVGYQHATWSDENFSHFMLQDLDQNQISMFLTRWHDAAYEDKSTGESKRILLERAISDSASIHQLAGNPLLLTMMAILNRTQDLPRDRAELYEQCARLLLHQWKVEMAFQAEPELATASLDFKDKRNLLLRVAREMHSGERGLAGNLIEEHVLHQTLASGLSDSEVPRASKAATSLIEQLRGRNFMLCFMGGKSYAFVHRTFLEYFCAVEIRERFEREQSISIDQLKLDIFSHWPDETWHEVLCLLAGMIAPKFVEELLDWLIDQPDPTNSRTNLFLAMRCLREVRNRKNIGAVEKKLRFAAKRLADYRGPYDGDPWDDESEYLEEIRERAVTHFFNVWPDSEDTISWMKEYILKGNSWDRFSAVRQMLSRFGNDPQILQWYINQVKNKRPSPLNSLILMQLVHYAPSNAAVQALIRSSLKSRNGELRGAAVRGACRTFIKDEIKQEIVKIATSDKSSYVRYVALGELGEQWSGDPQAYSVLKQTIETSKMSGHVQVALQALADYWRDDETYSYLMRLARDKSRPLATHVASVLLVSRWGDKPETLEIMREMASSPSSSPYWSHALDELCRCSHGDPETRATVLKLVAVEKTADHVVSAVRAFRYWAGDMEFFNVLKKILRSKRPQAIKVAALSTMCSSWADSPEVPQIVMNVLKGSPPLRLYNAAVNFLVSLRDDINAIYELKAILNRETNTTVCLNVVRNLIELEGFSEDHLLYLQNIVDNRQASEEMRIDAFNMIIENHWTQDKVYSLLTRVATGGEGSRIRKLAIFALARRRCTNPEIVKWLLELIKTADDQSVQVYALEEAALIFYAEAEFVETLVKTAEHSKSPVVVETALGIIHELGVEQLI